MKTDSGNVLAEKDETNNTVVQSITVERSVAITGSSPTGLTRGPVNNISLTLSSQALGSAARSATSYVLTNLGADGAPGGGDDSVVPVTPSYTDGSTTISLGLGAALPNGVYQLKALSGTPGLVNIHGLPLDGNNDGTLGDAFVSTFTVDSTPPAVTGSDITSSGLTINLFDKGGVLTSSVTNSANYALVSSGGDGILGNGNDVTVTPTSVTYAAGSGGAGVATLHFAGALPDELYRLTVSGIVDLAGNSLATTTNTLTLVTASAASLSPVSYSMPNGQTGTYHYWDDTYSGTGSRTTDLAPLSGGLGQLTDGVYGVDDWTANLGHGNAYEWVGWDNYQPTITFDFGQAKAFSSLAFHFNNSTTGGVFLPGTITASFSNDGTNFGSSVTYTTSAAERTNTSARWITIPTNQTARYVRATITDGNGPWIFLDEVAFAGAGSSGVSAVLDSSSDSGVSNTDGLTNVTKPKVDVTVNRAGLINVDFNGDGVVDASMLVGTPGTYQFTSNVTLPHGQDTVIATLNPPVGSPATATTTFTVDTQAPTLQPGSPTEQAPDSLRTITFSEPIDPSSIGVGNIQITGPESPSILSVSPAAGNSYTVVFSTIHTPGSYTLTASGVKDLAGNVGSPTNAFSLLADTTAPTVISVSPNGLTNQSVSTLRVNFSEPIDVSTFGPEDVTIHTPGGGTISTNGITVTPVGGQINAFPQYATSVVDFTSQYSTSPWSAAQMLGAPNTFSYGDIGTSWTASQANGGLEVVTLGYATPVFADSVTVRETLGNGFVRKIELRDENGIYHDVWHGTDTSPLGTPFDFLASFPTTAFRADAVRITVDKNQTTTWEEIDSVTLHGSTAIYPGLDASFDVSFPTQSNDGTYSVAIGPYIADLAGNLMSPTQLSQAYFNDFSSGAGGEWSNSTIALSNGEHFLGTNQYGFGNGTDTLTLSGLPAHSSVTVSFDLYIIQSWDGNGPAGGGPDFWQLSANGATVFASTFANYSGPNTQAYPNQTAPLGSGGSFAPKTGAFAQGHLGFGTGDFGDTTYRLTVTFPDTASALALGFKSLQNQNPGDEGWGIDNVLVQVNVATSGGYQSSFTIDKTPPTITTATPSGTMSNPVSSMNVTFSEPLSATSVTTSAFSLFGPAGSIALSNVSYVSGNTYLLTFPAQTANGNYTLMASAPISDLAGNLLVSTTRSFTVALPDVSFDTASPPAANPSSAVFGGTTTLTYTIKNAGTAAVFGPWIDNVYLSTSPTSLSGARLVTQINQTGPLAPGASIPVSTSIALPLSSGLTPGTYYLVVVADAGGAVLESVESNNQKATGALTLAYPALPDLTVQSVSAPASLTPGSTVQVGWTDFNSGSVAASGVWQDRVSLSRQADGSNPIDLAVFGYSGAAVAPGTGASWSVQVQIPTGLTPGSWYVVVRANSDGGLVESNVSNDVGVSAVSTIPVRLALTTTSATVTKGSSITGRVTRDGDVSLPLVIALTSSDPTKALVPATVTIPANFLYADFNIVGVQDGIYELNVPETITAKAVDGASQPLPNYLTATAGVSVSSPGTPTLGLSFSASSVLEGNSVVATLTRDASSVSQAMVVNLSSNFPSRLRVPVQATIPAGSLTTTFNVSAPTDNKVQATRSVTVTVSGLTTAAASLNVLDANDDTLTVSVNVPQVAEATEGVAALGTVTRPVVTSSPQVVQIDTDGTRLIVPHIITIPANQASAQFQISTITNSIAGDTALIQILARPVDAVDGVTPVDPGGAVGLMVVDSNSPALTATFPVSLVSEGDNLPPRQDIPAAIGTVRRNTSDTSQPLVVNIATDTPDKAYANPATVTIPAGASSTTFNIFTIHNNISDGTKVVTFTTSSAGFASGRAFISVTDIDQPDLTIQNAVAPMTAYTGQTVTLTYDRFNQGGADAPGGWIDKYYLSPDAILNTNSDTLLGSSGLSGGLARQGLNHVVTSLTLPTNMIGKFFILVQTDATNVVPEVFETNNVGWTQSTIAIAPAYTVTARASTHLTPMGSPITITGLASNSSDGTPAANEPITVRITQVGSGVRRVLNATTDGSGNYSVVFTPLQGEAGTYNVAAAHPSVTQDATQDVFKLIGMSASPSTAAPSLFFGKTAMQSITVTNLTDVPLTGLSWSVVGAPSDLQISVAPPTAATLAGNTTLPTTISVTSIGTTSETANFTLRLTSNEGAVLTFPMTVHVGPDLAVLSGPGSIAKSMLVSALTTYDFTVTNSGGSPTGPIQVLLPGGVSWLSIANAPLVGGIPTLPSIRSDGSATVSVLLNPGVTLPLGPYSGNFVLSPQSGSPISINYTFTATTDATGGLHVQVYDELQNLDTGAPFEVGGAKVDLLDVFTGAKVYQAVADSTGMASFTGVPRGNYNLAVSAAGHDSSSGTILIQPGVVTNQTVVLRSRQVTYNWSVTPVPFTDRYQVTITSTFATNVPAPVLTVDPGVIDLADPKFANGYAQVDLTITNQGLVAAHDVTIQFPDHPHWKLTPLVSRIDVLPARSDIVVPVIVQAQGDPSVCSEICSFTGSVNWDVVSFGRTIPFSVPIPVLNADDCCAPNTYVPPASGGGGGGVIVGGGGGGSGGSAIIYPVAQSPTFQFISPVEVDAQIKLQLSQAAVLTRTAFDAKLEIGNGATAPLQGLQASITVTTAATGVDATDRFAISTPALSNITIDASGNWTIPASSAGTADWTLLPNNLAAPTGPTQYLVGGVFSYIVNGARVTTPITPAAITVQPDAALNLTYFHQVNVYADDPYTPGLEPSVPFTLGVIVQNVGLGTANDLTITSAQPKIVENEKGLLIDFKIIGAALNNQPISNSLTVDFGNLAPGAIDVGLWQLTSTLQGQFTDFTATFEHTTSLGDTRTSLIKQVTVIPTVHTVLDVRPGADALPDFLTAEGPSKQVPTNVHLSDGSVLPVGQVSPTTTPAAPTPAAHSVGFTASMPAGFSYLELTDPNTDPANIALTGVRRSDGKFLPIGYDVWTTNRTFTLPFQRPIVENKIHIFDYNGTAGTYSYALVYGPLDPSGPKISSVSKVVPNPTATPVDYIDVTFDRAIDPTTFTTADLSLTLNGSPASLSAATITPLDSTNTLFRVGGLTPITTPEGTYVLTLSATGVADGWGDLGSGSASTSWVEASTHFTIASIDGLPSGVTKTAPFAVTVQFTKPIDTTTFTTNDVNLTLNGGPNLLTASAGATFNVLNSQAVQILLPVDLTQTEGLYVFTVSATGVNEPNGGPAGVGEVVDSWTLDTTAPTLLAIDPITTNPRNIVVPFVVVNFSEPIVASSFIPSMVRLTRAGDPSTNLLDGRFHITPLSTTSFELDDVNWPQSVGGVYTLTVAPTGVVDPAGNPSTGPVRTVSWTLDLTPPIVPGGFGITPDRGVSNSDLYTNTNNLTITGVASETSGHVTFYDDLSNTQLGDAPLNGSTAISFPTTLIGGMHRIRAIEVDQAGNFSSPVYFEVRIDTSVPAITSATAQTQPNPTSLVDRVDVVFSKPIDAATFTTADLALAMSGVALSTAGLTITPLTSSSFRVSGLSVAASGPGSYALAIDPRGIFDLAGNNGVDSPTTVQWTVATNSLTILSVSPVTNPARNTALDLVDVSFSTPIDKSTLTGADLTLTRDGVTVPVSGITVTLLSGATYRISGLAPFTALQGIYALTVNASTIQNLSGTSGYGSAGGSWMLDTTKPMSSVNTSLTVSPSFLISGVISATDPGTISSGVASVAVSVAVDNGGFSATPIAMLTPASPNFSYQGSPGHHYYFRSIATDLAGNAESKTTTEATAYIGIPAPITVVGSASLNDGSNPSNATFSVTVQGSDQYGPGITSFSVYVAIDGASPTLAATLPAGAPNAAGLYQASFTYQGKADGLSHTYKFFSVGTDTSNRVEAMHATPDITITHTFQQAPLVFTGLSIQHGAVERSFVEFVDLNFNQGGVALTNLFNAIVANPGNYLQLLGNPFGTNSTQAVSLSGVKFTLDSVHDMIELDFGSLGLGGVARGNLSLANYWKAMTAADGWYEANLDLSGSGTFNNASPHGSFERLIGDTNGNGVVDQTDLNLVAAQQGQNGLVLQGDLNGDGIVDSTDSYLVGKSKGRSLGANPFH